MGRPTRGCVGFQNQHLQTMTGGDGSSTEPSQAAADHDQIGSVAPAHRRQRPIRASQS
jgi:hypothetical protein